MQASRPELLRNGIVLVGHSMGGKIAQVLLDRPETVALVNGVVLLGPAPAGALQLPAHMREVQSKAYESLESADAVMRSVLIGDIERAGEDEIAALVADVVSGSPGARAAWPLYGMAENFEATVRLGIRQLEHDTPRALIIVGALDQVGPEAAVRRRVVTTLQEEGVKTEVEVLLGVGHMIPVEAPKEVAQLIELFLSSLSG